MIKINRRGFLRRSAVIPAAFFLPPATTWLHAAPQTSGEGKNEDWRKQFLFVDWHHVNKGELDTVLDPARISPSGKKLLDELSHDFNKDFPQGIEGRRP